MNRLIVAFSSDTAAHRICAWLAQSGFPARTVCRTGAEVVRAVRYMGGGSVICAARLPDYTADELYDDLDGQADLLVIGKPEQLSDCENPAIALLQSARGMAEPEAHRYLQRRSMEAHRKMADTARLIIAALEK